MKKNLTFIFLFLATSLQAQTVTDFMRMIDSQFKPYQDGEHLANDSLVDVKNGYYQRGFYDDTKSKSEQKILRQVAVFINKDGTKTIVEAISYWNFVCWDNEVKFYHYDGKKLCLEKNENYLPVLGEKELVSEKTLSIFKKYYLQLNENDYPTLSEFIFSAYDDIRYELPRYGTTIKVHLDYCDYFGEDIEISAEDWELIKNGTLTLELSYDKKLKKFKK